MRSNYVVRHPRGSRSHNDGDAEAVPLLSSRMLYLAKSDAVSGKPLVFLSKYFERSVIWFHRGASGPPFRFVLLRDGNPDTSTGRATFFRTEASEDLKKFISLSVASERVAARRLTADVRLAAENYLIDRLFATMDNLEKYKSQQFVRSFFNRLEREQSFSGLMSDLTFVQFCSQFSSHEHEVRLIQFAKLTTGLCT